MKTFIANVVFISSDFGVPEKAEVIVKNVDKIEDASEKASSFIRTCGRYSDVYIISVTTREIVEDVTIIF